MKVGFITTVDTNIGDDFIRQGIINLLKSTYQNRTIEFVLVNKHKPYTVYPVWHPLRYLPSLDGRRGGHFTKNILLKLFKNIGGSRFDDCDLIIQSGAPVLWPNCQECEWNVPIWQQVIGRLYKRIPVFNIAAGSCYPWTNQVQDYFPDTSEGNYAKLIGGYCKITTTRDELAENLFHQVGIKNYRLSCSAFFVNDDFQNETDGTYILINYMSGGGHFDWGQRIDNENWKRTITVVIDNLSKRFEIRFICHDEKEVELAKQLNPLIKIHFPKSVNEYMECVKSAMIGINNRMHASVAMASVGVPAISVCTDTRLLMLANLDLPHFYVEDANADVILSSCNQLLDNLEQERSKLFELKRRNFESYSKLFKANFK